MPITDLFRTLRQCNRQRLARRRRRHAARHGEAIDYAGWVERHDTIGDIERAHLQERVARLAARPLISVLLPVCDANPEWLDQAIASVRTQLYDHWELCIADDASDDPRVRALLARHAADEPRVRIAWRSRSGPGSVVANAALDLARGEFVALLDPADRLPEHALLCIAETCARFPDAALLYSDEDRLDARDRRCAPFFKSDWNLELFRSQDLVSHLAVHRTALARAVGGFRDGFDGARDYDLALRVVEVVGHDRIVHVPHVLYHARLRPSEANEGAGARRALEEHFMRTGIACDVAPHAGGWQRCDYRLPSPAPRVAIIVADAGGRRRLANCLETLRALPYPASDVVVASARNGESLVAACHHAMRETQAEVVAIVDSRCVFLTEDWLRPLVARACLPGVGAVGAKLLSLGGRIVGNAQLLGTRGAYSPLGLGTRAHYDGYCGRARLAQHVGALADGCVVVAKKHIDVFGGLDATFSDMGAALVDFTYRLRSHGWHNHWTPDVQGIGVSPGFRARRVAARDARRVAERWGFATLRDGHYNDNLGLARGRFHFASPPRVSLLRPWFESR